MANAIDVALHEQLLDRRVRLEAAVASFDRNAKLTRLLGEVDAGARAHGRGHLRVVRSVLRGD